MLGEIWIDCACLIIVNKYKPSMIELLFLIFELFEYCIESGLYLFGHTADTHDKMTVSI